MRRKLNVNMWVGFPLKCRDSYAKLKRGLLLISLTYAPSAGQVVVKCPFADKRGSICFILAAVQISHGGGGVKADS